MKELNGFKIGDTVKVIRNDSRTHNRKVGETYIIEEFPNDTCVRLFNKLGEHDGNGAMSIYCIEKVESNYEIY